MFGLPIEAEQVGRSSEVAVRLRGIDRPTGFAIHVTPGLQITYADLVLDSLARPLLDTLEAASDADWEQVRALGKSLTSVSVSTSLEINGVTWPEPSDIPTPEKVESFGLVAKVVSWHSSSTDDAVEAVASALAILIALLPIDVELPPNAIEGVEGNEGEPEGGRQKSWVTRYERSKANRAVAILLHGTRCIVCNLDFGERYSEIGQGYVEIHHLTPLHLMDGPAIVNPLTDLVPLCANCHRMAHRAEPPHTPQKLRQSLHKQVSSEAAD